MKKKILITYASYGSGHKTVANYIYEYFKEHGDYDVKIVDVMDYASLIGKINLKLFNMIFKFQFSLPATIGYELSDNKIVTAPYKIYTKACLNKQLQKDFLEYNPDLLIATHFFGGIMMGSINKKYHTKTKIITIITDYCSNCMWIQNHKYEDYIIVSNEIVKKEVLKFGVDEKKICPFGIPLSSKFKVTDDKEKIKLKYNIKNNKPIILFFGGGSMGSSFTYNYLKAILKLKLDINIIFVAGKNVELQNKVNDLVMKENTPNITVLGFTNDVSNLLNIATLVITKPGGLSVTEALEMKTPMILIPGNGGQENYNANYVTKNKFGLRVRTPFQLSRVMKKINNNPEIVQNMYNNLKNQEENKSIEKLFNLVEKELK
ncbi:MAG: glycosyltransferase [Bacilli bacterium]